MPASLSSRPSGELRVAAMARIVSLDELFEGRLLQVLRAAVAASRVDVAEGPLPGERKLGARRR
jgi:hypothetical protein